MEDVLARAGLRQRSRVVVWKSVWVRLALYVPFPIFQFMNHSAPLGVSVFISSSLTSKLFSLILGYQTQGFDID